MEAELQKFRQKKIAEERSVRIKNYLQNIYNQWTLKLSAAVLPEPPQQQGDNRSSSEDEDDDDDTTTSSNGKERRDKKLLLKKSKGKKLNKALSLSTQTNKDNIEIVNERDNNSDNAADNDDDDEEEDVICPQPIKWASIALKVLKFLMWLLTYIGFIKIGFGAVFFCISALLFIWFSTDSRRRKRKQGEKSAYSVFNPNCEPIDGALDPKQLEKQLIYGPIGHFAG